MEKHRLRKLMAYVYMPLIFAILGYGIVYIAAKPILDIGVSIGGMFLSSTVGNGNQMEGKSFEKPDITDANSQPETLLYSEIQYPEYGDHYAKIECETIGLSADVYYGDDNNLLQKGVGQYIGSGIPGGGRQVMLVGHNVTVFSPLEAIKAGDVVTVTTTYGVYQYRITNTKVLDSKDTTAYDLLAEKEELVMYTCYPFTTLGSTNQRFFIYGEKILGPTLVSEGGQS